MGKVLVWIGIALALWLVWRLAGISRRRTEAARASRSAPDGSREGAGPVGSRPELMMQCAVCGVHLPGTEARFARGRVYCSDAHRDGDTDGAASGDGR
jgi:uncharacterized protein